MSVQYSIELAAFFFCAVVVLAVAARRVGFPYPILLVLAGAGLGLAPGFPELAIDPDVIFLGCLPPLLYSAAIRMPWHEFRANILPIGSLALGLVLATTAAVGTAAWLLIPGMTIAAAATLGAIVAPTDAVAAIAMTRRLGIPERVVTILEGESLVNDASSLVAYQFAVVAVVTGVFHWGNAGLSFVLAAGGGVLLGMGAGALVAKLLSVIDDSAARITFSLVTPFLVFIIGEEIGVSGVLAVVTTGLYVGRRRSEIFSASSRMEENAVFSMIEYLMNGVIFLLIGVQLHHILRGLDGWSNADLFGYASVISVIVLAVRLLWAYPMARLVNLARRRFSQDKHPMLDWRHQVLVGWAGMRGVVSLAAALALPITTQSGEAFPDRGLIIFRTACVVLVTLVANGLSLPLVARAIGGRESLDQDAEQQARTAILHASVAEFDRRMEASLLPLPAEELMWVREMLVESLRLAKEQAGEKAQHESQIGALGFYLLLLAEQRKELRRLFHRRKIRKATFQKLEREIDLEETRSRSQIGEQAATPHGRPRS
ncbi:MAG: Na+/H+ antiporter [bacterium]